MQNFRFFKKLDQYREFIFEEIFVTPEFRNNVFYRGLIEFVIEHRAPLFFSLTHEEEFSHFTQYFNAVLDRGDYYKNDFVRSMYFAHDFVHMLFDNPLRPRDMTFEKFCEVLNVNEWIASNETETFTYYRIDDMREKSWEYTIMYDLLKRAGRTEMPNIKEMLEMRKHIINGGSVPELEGHPDTQMVFDFLRKYKENNAVWCKLWYENFPEIKALYAENRLCLPVLEYEKILAHYAPGTYFSNQQKSYEANVMQNITNLVLLTGIGKEFIPKNFDDCERSLAALEGKVVMPEVAKHFHFTYIKNKKVGTPQAQPVIENNAQ